MKLLAIPLHVFFIGLISLSACTALAQIQPGPFIDTVTFSNAHRSIQPPPLMLAVAEGELWEILSSDGATADHGGKIYPGTLLKSGRSIILGAGSVTINKFRAQQMVPLESLERIKKDVSRLELELQSSQKHFESFRMEWIKDFAKSIETIVTNVATTTVEAVVHAQYENRIKDLENRLRILDSDKHPEEKETKQDDPSKKSTSTTPPLPPPTH